LPGQEVLDLGSGNGWPGLAAKLWVGQVRLSLMDSRRGACKFLRKFIEYSGLDGVAVVEKRGEEAARAPDFREKFDVVVSRAMAPPGVVLEIASGLVTVGGKVLLWLGPGQEKVLETDGSRILGLRLRETRQYELSEDMGKRIIAVYSKMDSLASIYPRRYASMKKRPLV